MPHTSKNTLDISRAKSGVFQIPLLQGVEFCEAKLLSSKLEEF